MKFTTAIPFAVDSENEAIQKILQACDAILGGNGELFSNQLKEKDREIKKLKKRIKELENS